MKKLIEKIFKFCSVGIICFFIDYGVLYILTEFIGISYLISSAVSFSFSVIINYLLSMKFVFRSRKNVNKAGEFSAFVILSVIAVSYTHLRAHETD